MERAAAGPPFRALAQCSTRSRVSKRGWWKEATSPHGVHVGVGGAQHLVDRDAPAVLAAREFQARGLGEAGARGGADGGEDVVRGVLLAVVGAGGQHHAVLADDLGEPGAEVEPHAVLAVQLGEDLAQFGAEHAVQRGRPVFDDGDLGAVFAGRRGDLQADPAGFRR